MAVIEFVDRDEEARGKDTRPVRRRRRRRRARRRRLAPLGPQYRRAASRLPFVFGQSEASSVKNSQAPDRL